MVYCFYTDCNIIYYYMDMIKTCDDVFKYGKWNGDVDVDWYEDWL